MRKGRVLLVCVPLVLFLMSTNGRTIDQMIAASYRSPEGRKASSHSSAPDSDSVIVELDILYKKAEWDKRSRGRRHRGKRMSEKLDSRKWTNNTVPYRMSSLFDSTEVDTIHAAMAEWENYTCVKFRKIPNNEAGLEINRDYVEIRHGASGCFANVGMQSGEQLINLANDCIKKNIVIHELGHSIGLYHEHRRPDRDDYVTINLTNVKTDPQGRWDYRKEFKKESWDYVTAHGTQYDLTSIMHYGMTFFSVSENKPTIIPKDSFYNNIIGKSPGLSFGDIERVNYMYHCNEACPPKSCPGKGFVGTDCQCWCPGNVTEGTPVIRCPEEKTESCRLSGNPDYKSKNCLYRYIKFLEKKVNKINKKEVVNKENIASIKGTVASLERRIRILGNSRRSPSAERHPRDCADIYKSGKRSDGVYTIYPQPNRPVAAFCDMRRDGGGWTLIQRRKNGFVDFNQGWEAYAQGFGNIHNGDHWLGNRHVAALTSAKTYKLHVLLEDWSEETRYAIYRSFQIGSESEFFKLNLDGYSGTAGNGFIQQNRVKFSTPDNDNDNGRGNCAFDYKAGFWYTYCFYSNLNGLYQKSSSILGNWTHPYGIIWTPWHGGTYSLKSTVLKIRPADFSSV